MAVKARTRNLATLADDEDGIEVDPKHKQYVAGLWGDVNFNRRVVEKKREYIEAIDRIGVKVASVDSLATALNRQVTKINESKANIIRVKQLLAAGCEPTTPNIEWYSGYIKAPELDWRGSIKNEAENKGWPSANAGSAAPGTRVAYWLYRAPIPVAVLEQYALVEHLLDSVRIYSPNIEDFQQVPMPVPHDPVMIGRVDLTTPQYFEIARWDIDKDLAEIFADEPKRKKAK